MTCPLVSPFPLLFLLFLPSAGDLLRDERQRLGSQYGTLIETFIKNGEIVPMEITIALLEQAMHASKTKRFLIDGFPRALDQGFKFEETVIPSSFVLYFECPEEVMEQRLLKRGETSGRVDDNIESIRKRFATFKSTSFPVIEHYDKLGKVVKASAEFFFFSGFLRKVKLDRENNANFHADFNTPFFLNQVSCLQPPEKVYAQVKAHLEKKLKEVGMK
jgi:UMP-CMP kinase